MPNCKNGVVTLDRAGAYLALNTFLLLFGGARFVWNFAFAPIVSTLRHRNMRQPDPFSQDQDQDQVASGENVKPKVS